MANRIIVLTEEALKRVFAGLAELQAKYSHVIINDIDAQLAMSEQDVKSYVTLVETHLAPFKEAIAS